MISKFLSELLIAKSPTGYEQEAQKVVDNWVEPISDSYK